MALVIFDWNGTLALDNELVPGAAELLEKLDGHYIAVVSRCKGDKEERRSIISNLVPMAKEILITSSEKYDPMKKVFKTYTDIIQKGVAPIEVFVIGDRIQKDIAPGNSLCFTTIWIRGGRFPHELPRTIEEVPRLSVYGLADLLEEPFSLIAAINAQRNEVW